MSGPRLEEATYARKQIFSRVGLLAWSHRRRLETGRMLLAQRPRGSLLDYGCGDGSFIAATHDLCTSALGIEIDDALVAQCRARFAELPHVRFALPDGLGAERFDTVMCMEVLEHCTDDVRATVLQALRAHVADDGTVIISVPNETGAALLLKQGVRALAGWRGYADYRQRETYSLRELGRMLRGRAIERPRYPSALPHGPRFYHGHKGFDWRVLQRELAALFDVEAPRFSPVAALGGRLASQVWFVCRRGPGTRYPICSHTA